MYKWFREDLQLKHSNRIPTTKHDTCERTSTSKMNLYIPFKYIILFCLILDFLSITFIIVDIDTVYISCTILLF